MPTVLLFMYIFKEQSYHDNIFWEIRKYNINPNKTGPFGGNFFPGGVNLISPSYFKKYLSNINIT